MQYVGRAFDSVSKTWSSINPSTLSGAIDVIIVENEAGELNSSPFHVRFGKFQLLRPSQKKVDFIINGKLTNLPMKLGDGGEAFFVFETSKNLDVPNDLITSPVLSAASSPPSSPPISPQKLSYNDEDDPLDNKHNVHDLQEPEFLNISQPSLSSPDITTTKPLEIIPSHSELDLLKHQKLRDNNHTGNSTPIYSTSPKEAATLEKFQNLTKKLTRINIPTKIDNNGDLSLDMNGYKSSEQNIHNADDLLKKLLSEEFGDDVDVSQFVKQDRNGHIKIFSHEDLGHFSNDSLDLTTSSSPISNFLDDSSFENPPTTESTSSDTTTSSSSSTTNFVKTLRLTSDQLKYLDLKPGENDLCFSVDKGKAIITSKLYLWKQNVPIVISDIDGTITKSDALGHVLTMIGRDWTHPGVAKLFKDIELNGYNIMYLTARSVGQADSTRSYLRNIEQDGVKLPDGPVILSPDRTMAALKREVILKKPEVFKMACLNDLKNLYGDKEHPFYAGFGNRITDALSYRSVGIPSSRIFTINPIGEVHMELLELAGYKSSYIFINELVDHFFPPVFNSNIDDEGYTDVNYWREPLPALSDLSDEEEEVFKEDKGKGEIPVGEDEKENEVSKVYNPMNVYQKKNEELVGIDDLDKDYDESKDEDYEENDNDEDEDEEEEEEDYYDDEADVDNNEDNEYDDEENEEFSDESFDEDGEFDEDDLDEELLDYELQKTPESSTSLSSKNKKLGFLPMNTDHVDNISINSNNVNGIHSPNFIKASDLINRLSINDTSPTKSNYKAKFKGKTNQDPE